MTAAGGGITVWPDAAPGEVVRLWEGLGYNRRAVHLHRAATEMVQRHGGQVPATLPELLALPGVGPYTARAVLAHEARLVEPLGAGRQLRALLEPVRQRARKQQIAQAS